MIGKQRLKVLLKLIQAIRHTTLPAITQDYYPGALFLRQVTDTDNQAYK